MNWMSKTRMSMAPGTATSASKPGPVAAVGALAGAGAAASNRRVSNGLKEFLWLISDAKGGRILDLGQVSQDTLTFFIEKGYRISTEDMLRSWKDFLTAEEERMRRAPVGGDGERVTRGMLAEKFLEIALQYPEDNFNGVLAWDLLDYFDGEMLERVMNRLHALMRPGGAVLGLFHMKSPERFHRYRIVDVQTIELLPASTIAVHARVFQNREILDLFGKFRSSKTFVGRDQLREGLFLK
jgi:hypothetical protein